MRAATPGILSGPGSAGAVVIPGRRAVHIECHLARPQAKDDRLRRLVARGDLAMNHARFHADDIARSALEDVRSVRPELHPRLPREDIDVALVRAVVVPP